MVSGLRLRPGTVGQPYIGIRSKILNPDPQTGIGEIAARARDQYYKTVCVVIERRRIKARF